MTDTTDLGVGAPGLGAGVTLALKIFGPSADYLGTRLLDATKASENFVRVLLRTRAKIGPDLEDASKILPPRIARRVLDEAPFMDSEIGAEYLSGILAGSRGAGVDDRGLYYLDLVQRLSALTLRLHFVVYRRLFESMRDADPRQPIDPSQTLVAVDLDEFFLQGIANAGAPEVKPDAQSIDEWAIELRGSVRHAREVLAYLELVDIRGYVELEKDSPINLSGYPTTAWLYAPTTFGRELFAFACGFGSKESFERNVGDLSFADDLPLSKTASLLANAPANHAEIPGATFTYVPGLRPFR